jgi:hypothetical protein
VILQGNFREFFLEKKIQRKVFLVCAVDLNNIGERGAISSSVSINWSYLIRLSNSIHSQQCVMGNRPKCWGHDLWFFFFGRGWMMVSSFNLSVPPLVSSRVAVLCRGLFAPICPRRRLCAVGGWWWWGWDDGCVPFSPLSEPVVVVRHDR